MSSIELNQRLKRMDGDLPERLAAALVTGRRGRAAQHRMAPELSYGRHAGPAPPTARRAAVMMLLFQRGGEWHLPLTERPAHLTRHGGQISLPGGVVDSGESSRDAALRELGEELGVASDVTLLGQLADCYIFASDFLVTPWVSFTRSEPHWQPHDEEVQQVVELPLGQLIDDAAIGRTTIRRGPLVFHAPCLQIGAACIWGATSVMLGELAEVIRGM